MNPKNDRPDAFWTTLVSCGVLNLDQVADYRQHINSAERAPIGKLLMQNGFLSVRGVMDVLGLQITEPDVRFGDLAIREGYCAEADVLQCLELQRKLAPNPIKMLLEDPAVCRDTLVEALASYSEMLEVGAGV